MDIKMKSIFQILLLFLITFTFQLFAQADISTSILIDDGAGGSKNLHFGLDSTATDGIDILLGESDLPPFPPPGAFEARFFLPDNNFTGTLGSYDDYRNAVLPFTGEKEFRLAYQPGTGTVINITWDFPQSITGVLQDIINGYLINVNMVDSGSYTVTNPDAFNRLKMLINYDAIIPVELVSFSASVNGGNVDLTWQTASELNNSGFEIEKKSVSTDWQKIGFVNGNGTTTETKSYSYRDENLSSGKYQYRLKQIDFDGSSSYLKVIQLDINAPIDFVLNQNFPNPFNPSTNISFTIPKATHVKITIYNKIGERVGELVNKNLEAGSYSYSWNASKQSSDIYFYELQTDGYRSIRKMTLIK